MNIRTFKRPDGQWQAVTDDWDGDPEEPFAVAQSPQDAADDLCDKLGIWPPIKIES